MSAGKIEPGRPRNDLGLLAPRFREAVERAIDACLLRGMDAIVYESFRSAELQAAYYARGRTIIPPIEPVTNAISNLHSWHGYGLAVDVISASCGWSVGAEWFADVAECFREQGSRWGGEWKQPDLPHFQWGLCKPSPSGQARALVQRKGVRAVWSLLEAA